MARNPAFDSTRYPHPITATFEQSLPHVTMLRSRYEWFTRLEVIAKAAIERDLCAAVHDDPALRTRQTRADLDSADAELRIAIDAHHAAATR